jgi:hypothetical protein
MFEAVGCLRLDVSGYCVFQDSGLLEDCNAGFSLHIPLVLFVYVLTVLFAVFFNSSLVAFK